jgi:hypothetical protein
MSGRCSPTMTTELQYKTPADELRVCVEGLPFRAANMHMQPHGALRSAPVTFMSKEINHDGLVLGGFHCRTVTVIETRRCMQLTGLAGKLHA